jgi:ubiquinone biosynthesis protein
MDIVRTGIGITKTIRNVTRLREIVRVFAINGFDEFIIQMGLHHKIPGFVIPKSRIKNAIDQKLSEDKDVWSSLAFRLRKSFEQLGPGFIKLGQLLATREDLFPPQFIQELKQLQNNVEKISFEVAIKVLEASLGKSYLDVFENLEREPIGTASIGAVYRGRLKTGQHVVVKIRKPNVDQIIKNDFEILNFLVQQIEKFSEDVRYLGLSRAFKDFEQSIQLELNFNIETLNCKRLKDNISLVDKENILVIPSIYQEYCSESIIVMDLLDGTAFNRLDSNEINDELVQKLHKSVDLFLHTLLSDGFFHADLHGGNFLLLKNGKIGIIDFGLMGMLSRKNRASLITILYALSTHNYENLVHEFLDVAEYDMIPDEESLIRDVKDCLRPFVGLSVQQTNMTELLSVIVQTLSRHQIYLPQEWFIIFRALMTLDGVGKSIGMDLNIFELLEKNIRPIMKEILSHDSLKEDLIWFGRDVMNSAKTMPRHIRWYLKDFAREKYNYKLIISNLDVLESSIQRSFYFFGMVFSASILVCCGIYFIPVKSLLTLESIPTISWLFWLISLVLFWHGHRAVKLK